MKLNRGIKEDKLLLTLGYNDLNSLSLSLCASIHSLPHNKWLEMRGNKKDEMKSRHYIYFPPISLIKFYALSMITNTQTH